MYSPYYLGKIKNINLSNSNDKAPKYVLLKESINPKSFISISQEVFKYKDINSKQVYISKDFSDMVKLDNKTSMKDLSSLKNVVALYKLNGLTRHGKRMIKKIERKINK